MTRRCPFSCLKKVPFRDYIWSKLNLFPRKHPWQTWTRRAKSSGKCKRKGRQSGEAKRDKSRSRSVLFSIVHSERLQRGAICTHRLQYNHNNNKCKNKNPGLKVTRKFKELIVLSKDIRRREQLSCYFAINTKFQVLIISLERACLLYNERNMYQSFFPTLLKNKGHTKGAANRGR